jgi:MerR family transcriptional regulator, copper efflux regulator
MAPQRIATRKSRKMTSYRIGEVTKLLGISADTLRYYEKIRLLSAISRTGSGIRIYDDRDISRLRFIRRAQKMRFSLKEIAELLTMREDPQHARDEVRVLTQGKLSEIEEHLDDLRFLRNELRLLLNLCRASKDGCPIIERIDREEV